MLRLLQSVHSDLLCPHHSEFSSESFTLRASILWILKQVQDDIFFGPDDSPLRLLQSVHSDLLGPRHSEFSSESFYLLSSLQQILKQVQDDERRVKFFSSWFTLLCYGRGKRHENFPHQWSGRMKIFKCLPDRWVGFLRPTQYSDFLSETFYRSSGVKALRLIWNLNEPCGQSATEGR